MRKDTRYSQVHRRASDAALQAALAEFDGIRARMDVFSQAQVTVFTAGVTAIGVIVGLALDKHNSNLLLFISVLAPVLVSTHTDLRNRIGENGAYIGAKLWPYIRRLSRADLPSWEEHWEYRVNKYLILVGVSQAPALLLAASFAVLAIRSGVVFHGHHHPQEDGDGGYVVLWYVGMALTILSGGYTATVLNALRDAKAKVDKSDGALNGDSSKPSQSAG